jgi:hypothetical protein
MNRPFLKLQSDAITSIGQPLAIDNSRKTSQIPSQRPEYQSLVQIFSSLAQDAHTNGAYVFSNRPLYCGRILQAGNLYGDSQPYPFLNSASPRRHGNLPFQTGLAFLVPDRKAQEVLTNPEYLSSVAAWPIEPHFHLFQAPANSEPRLDFADPRSMVSRALASSRAKLGLPPLSGYRELGCWR